MHDEAITEIGIDGEGRLYVRPSNSSFEHIYRTASGVRWDEEAGCLFAPVPRDWTQRRWLDRIVADVADEYRVRLRITAITRWTGITPEAELELRAATQS